MSTSRANRGGPAPAAEAPAAPAPASRGASRSPAKPLSRGAGARPRRRRDVSRRLGVVAAILALAVLGLGAIFALNRGGAASGGGLAGQYPFQVGNPGAGQPAPPVRLPSTAGGMFDLASLRGQTVLLYFQEGVMCQPCWDQLKDIEARWPAFQALGIDRIVSITSDPLDVLKQKVADERLSTPLLSDPGVGVSRTYEANRYGMMGMSMNGHSFVLVNPEGVITWRRDYGGAPKFTMYVPVPNLLADLQAGPASAAR